MPRSKSIKNKKSKIAPKETSFSDRINEDVSTKQSTLSFILGILIVVVLGILIFNFFTRSKNNLSSNTNQNLGQITQQAANTTPEMKKDNPGKYTVKSGDTLFTIAEKYYNDGYQYPKIVQANKIPDENIIEVGQEITIPATTTASAPTTAPSPSGITTPKLANQGNLSDNGTGGAINQTIWGETITTDTYTVQPGDWLSKIAGRAYGDIYAFDKIAKANNMSNPDNIEPGTVLKIPR